jgi:hypothetical protein
MRTKIYLIGLLFTTFLVLSACKSETAEKIKSAKESVNQAKDLVKNVKNIEKTSKDLEKRVEELKKITLLIMRNLKAGCPKNLGTWKGVHLHFRHHPLPPERLNSKTGQVISQ